MTRFKLYIPGPVDVDDEILQEMSSPSLPHYGSVWMSIYDETMDLLHRLYGTENEMFLMPGPGSAGMESAIASIVPPGKPICVITNGFFGNRLVTIAEHHGARPVKVASAWGQTIDLDAIRDTLRRKPDCRAVAMVHHETSTGILNPLAEVAAIAHEFDLPLIVDAISSLGGVPLPVDKWKIDVCVTVPNKALECPPGVAILSVSDRAWQKIEANTTSSAGWYLNLAVWREAATNPLRRYPFLTTQPTQNIMAMRIALRRIFETGLEAHLARFTRTAGQVRAGMQALGFALFVQPPARLCPLITAFRPPAGTTPGDLIAYLYEKADILIAGGIAQLSDQIVRIGHMGKATTDPYTQTLLDQVSAFVHAHQS